MFACPITTVTAYFFSQEENKTWDISQRKQLDDLLASCFQAKISSWQELQPKERPTRDGLRFSHTRKIWIGSGEQSRKTWIIKLDTAVQRINKPPVLFPHADEIAYKISKLLKWSTVPKTMIFHQEEENLFPEKSYYFHLIERFKNKTHPITCTLQEYVEGETVPQKKELEEGTKTLPHIQSSSYQHAFFLELILNDCDAREDNYLISEKGIIHKCDNEYLGLTFNPVALNHFDKEKDKIISPKIIRDILHLSAEQFSTLQKKYSQRDLQLAKFWVNEPIKMEYPNLEKNTSEIWEKFKTNLFFIQSAINHLKKTEKPITLSAIQIQYQHMETEREAAQKAQVEIRVMQVKQRIENEKRNQQKLKWEKEKYASPTLCDTGLQSIYKWIVQEHCVILHSQGRDCLIYYNGMEKTIKDLNIIWVDIPLDLLHPKGLPEELRKNNLLLAPREIQEELVHKKLIPKKTYSFSLSKL